MAESVHSVMALTRAFILPDAGSIQLELAVAGNPRLTLLMTPNTLGQVVAGLTELETAAQIQIGSTTGHVATQASDVSEIHIQSAAGGNNIVVSFRNSKGRFQSFALSLEQAQKLRADARKAEEMARKLASQSRN